MIYRYHVRYFALNSEISFLNHYKSTDVHLEIARINFAESYIKWSYRPVLTQRFSWTPKGTQCTVGFGFAQWRRKSYTENLTSIIFGDPCPVQKWRCTVTNYISLRSGECNAFPIECKLHFTKIQRIDGNVKIKGTYVTCQNIDNTTRKLPIRVWWNITGYIVLRPPHPP